MRITDSAGAIDVTLTYGHPDFPQRVTALSQDDGQQRWPLMTWTYDHRGMLAGATDATGITRRAYRYNDDRLMVWHRQAGGPECEYRWEKLDHWRVTAHRTSAGDRCRIAYDLDRGLTTVTREDGTQRLHYWNADQMVTCLVDERGERWQFAWDDNGQLLSETDPQGSTWRYEYDSNGNLARTTDPLGRVRSTEWLPHRALPVRELDAAGNSTTYEWDGHHGLHRITHPDGTTTTLIRDEYGQVKDETDPKGGRHHRTYNRAGR